MPFSLQYPRRSVCNKSGIRWPRLPGRKRPVCPRERTLKGPATPKPAPHAEGRSRSFPRDRPVIYGRGTRVARTWFIPPFPDGGFLGETGSVGRGPFTVLSPGQAGRLRPAAPRPPEPEPTAPLRHHRGPSFSRPFSRFRPFALSRHEFVSQFSRPFPGDTSLSGRHETE